MSNAEQLLAQTKDALTTLLTQTKLIPAFSMKPEIKDLVKKMATAVREGRVGDAVDVGQEALKAARNLFGAFLNRSAVDKVEEGETIRASHFTNIISELRYQKYEADLIGRVEAKRVELVAAIKAETNGDFSQRITSYNAVNAEIETVKSEQLRRDNEYRAEQDRLMAAAKRGRQGDAKAAEKARGDNQRAILIAEREKQADELLKLV